MIVRNGRDEKRVPFWAALVVSVGLVAMPAGVAWGVNLAQTRSMDARLTKAEKKLENVATEADLEKFEGKLDKINGNLISLLVALKVRVGP